MFAAMVAALLIYSPRSHAQAIVPKDQALAKCISDGDAVKAGVPNVNSWTCTDVPETATPDPDDGMYNCTYKFTFEGGDTAGPFSCSGYYPTASGSYPYNAPGSVCGDIVGGMAYTLRTSSSWPPSGVGCMDHDGVSCATIVDVISSPSATNGPNGTVYTYGGQDTFTGAVCPAGEDRDPLDPQTDEDGWKCDPSTGVCLDPDNNPNVCTFNPDGSRSACVKKDPGDPNNPPPEPDPEPEDPRDKETASGGGSCTAAPACSGGPIACATLWQQWKTRCAVEKAGTTIGSNATCSQRLSTGYGCVGDAATCRNLNDTHAIRCSIEGLSSVGGADGDGDDPFDKASERAAIDAASQGGDGLDGINPRDAWASPNAGAGVSTSLFGGGGGCPTFPAVTVGNSTFTAPPNFCSFVAMIRLIFLSVAYIWALKIVGD